MIRFHKGHLRSRLFGAAVAVFVAAPLASCSSPSVTHLVWEPLTSDEVALRLTSPTGSIRQPGFTEDIEEQLPALLELGLFVGELAAVADDLRSTDYSQEIAQVSAVKPAVTETEGVTQSGSFFVELACPGALTLPQRDFSHGMVRLDSPLFINDDGSELAAGGDVLLSFLACELGSQIFDARLPSLFLASSQAQELPLVDGTVADDALALAIEGNALTPAREGSPLGIVAISCRGARRCRETIALTAELQAADSRTYVISAQYERATWLSGGSISLSLKGSDGQTTCSLTRASTTERPALHCER